MDPEGRSAGQDGAGQEAAAGEDGGSVGDEGLGLSHIGEEVPEADAIEQAMPADFDEDDERR
ncbi:MAG: hypothetical protein ACRDY2_02265 [Acidimicrobiales bacterium]